jgi:hypothetical protein
VLSLHWGLVWGREGGLGWLGGGEGIGVPYLLLWQEGFAVVWGVIGLDIQVHFLLGSVFAFVAGHACYGGCWLVWVGVGQCG